MIDPISDGGHARASRAVIVAPSVGWGGGIERYVSGVVAALEQCGIPFVRLDLRAAAEPAPTMLRKLAFMRTVLSTLRRSDEPTRLLLAHPGLVKIAVPARHVSCCTGTTVHYHGIEAWQARRVPGARLARRADVRATTGSSFTSGVLQRYFASTVIAPPFPRAWFRTLTSARDTTVEHTGSRPDDPLRLLTVFRLSDWADKGLPTIIAAAARLDRPVVLTVAGSGAASQQLRNSLHSEPWVRLKTDLTDAELAAEYARADIYVGATRTRTGRHASGEGFGLTLVEAQLAGTAVIAPAYGGSHDTFQAGVTGMAAPDESVDALEGCLREMAADPARLTDMSAAAHEWSRAAFDPARSAALLVSAIL